MTQAQFLFQLWIIEPTNAWFGQFRRLLVRHEHLFSTYRAFFYLACL
jgi:transposase